jgi:ABC-2 type transport system permease protein
VGERFGNVFRLGVKELRSLRSDPVLSFLIVYTFTVAVYTVATGAKFEVANASVAVVDEDRSDLSRRIQSALLPPYFVAVGEVAPAVVEAGMESGRFVFALDIPPDFESDVLAGMRPAVQLGVDATAMTQAGNGAIYLENIVVREVVDFVHRGERAGPLPIELVAHARFNPNLTSSWFNSVMQVINNITMLSVILCGAALIREREHGTIEHLLVMPVTPTDIMLAKMWANGLVIVLAAILSLRIVVQGLLHVPIAGSMVLFAAGAVLYQLTVTGLGILLATLTRSMPQFSLLAMPVLIVMNLLSGSTTPMESMPEWLRTVLQVSPAVHFVAFAQAVLYRGAGVEIVWPHMVALVAIGALFLTSSLFRFRAAMASLRG